MECEYKYSLQDRETGNLYRDMFPYSEVPKCKMCIRDRSSGLSQCIQTTGAPEGRVGESSFFMRLRFLPMRLFAAASISGVER